MTASRHARLSIYFGGFRRIGGVEVFFVELLRALGPKEGGVEFFVWGPPRPEYCDLAAVGVRIDRSSIARGGSWRIPDHVLALRNLGALWRTETLIFAKFPPRWFLHLVRLAARRHRRRLRVLYVTSQEPATLWPNGVPRVIDEAVSAMLVQTDGFQSQLRALGYTGDVHVVPLLPPRAAVQATPRPSRNGARLRLGYLGRLSRQKNVGYLFEIVARLGVSVELHVFGTGPEERILERRADEMGLPVVFHGEVEPNAVPQHLDDCDVVAITSLYEGQCLVALEALARGRPCVATPVGSLPEVLNLTRAGLLIPQADADTAARRVTTFLRQLNENPELIESCIIEKFCTAFNRSKILESYVKIIDGKFNAKN